LAAAGQFLSPERLGPRSRAEGAIDDAIIAGWTGGDPAAVETHFRELEALSVKRPASSPIFYRFAAARLTTGGLQMAMACLERNASEAQQALSAGEIDRPST
jgi:hypothetical protein